MSWGSGFGFDLSEGEYCCDGASWVVIFTFLKVMGLDQMLVVTMSFLSAVLGVGFRMTSTVSLILMWGE